MHPDLYLPLHRQREQEMLAGLRHAQPPAGTSSGRAVAGFAGRAAAVVGRALRGLDAKVPPVECCPAM